MAKIFSSYGSSPCLGYISDHLDDYSLIAPDPNELFGNDLDWGCSIYSDIQKMDSGNNLPLDCFFDLEPSKPEIPISDCMWSGNTGVLSSSASSTGSELAASRAVPPAVINGNVINVKQQEQQAPTVVVAGKMNKVQQLQKQQQPQQQQSQQRNFELKVAVKSEPSDDYEQQLQQHSILNSKGTQQQQQQQKQKQPQQQQQQQITVQSMQHIPPGTSLLRKSNTLQQQQQQQQLQQRKLQQQQRQQQQQQLKLNNTNTQSTLQSCNPKTVMLSTNNYNNNNNSSSNRNNNNSAVFITNIDAMSYELPDTPPSLDDEATDIKPSNIDLHACIMGSNNISLNNESIIDNISKQLQDTSTDKINTRLTTDRPNINEVLEVITGDESTSKCLADLMLSRNSDCYSDEDESTANSGYGSGSSLHDGDFSFGRNSPVPSQASSQTSVSRHNPQAYYHSDHSYTRCKDGMDDLSNSAYTPSDSEEEIDVVSISDKKLPTNPSDRDRRALQNKVAFKFSNPRGDVNTVTPRRRTSYALPYTPASSSPVKSVATTRYPSPSPSVTPHPGLTPQMRQVMNIMPGDSCSTPTRKRLTCGGINSADVKRDLGYTLPPSKKHRAKKMKHHGSSMSSSSNSSVVNSSSVRRHYSMDETADTIEKRNLHNDMERQRRIGLKNLFEELKKQIPSIRDKERAPKVNILREAAKLCEQLTREDQQLMEQKAALKEQMRRRQEQLARLRSLQRD